MLQSLILCLLLPWTAALTLSVANNTVPIDQPLEVDWAKDEGDEGLQALTFYIVPDDQIPVPLPVPGSSMPVGPDQEEGRISLQLPPGTQSGPYIIKAFEGSQLDIKPHDQSLAEYHLQLEVLPPFGSVGAGGSNGSTLGTTSDSIGPDGSNGSTPTVSLSSPTSAEPQSTTFVMSSTSSFATSDSTSVPNQAASGSTSPSVVPANAALASTSKTPVIIGSTIGALVALALIALAILVLRRRKTRKETVQFYEHKMVRPTSPPPPTGMDSPLSWEPLTLHQDGLDRHDTDVKQAVEPEPLPAYGYSNYDFIEKADYHDTNARSTLPYGAMPASTSRVPKIFTTPATPPESDSSVLNGPQMSFGDAGSDLHHDSNSPSSRAYGGLG